MLLEELEVDARLVVVAVEVRVRRDLDEVAVTLGGLGEDREVVDVVVVATRAIEPARGDHVGLGADHRRETRFARGGVEVDDAVHVPVVGDADCRLAVGCRGGHDVLHAGRTVEHRILGVQMEMHERLGQEGEPSLSTALFTGLWTSYMGVIRTILTRNRGHACIPSHVSAHAAAPAGQEGDLDFGRRDGAMGRSEPGLAREGGVDEPDRIAGREHDVADTPARGPGGIRAEPALVEQLVA